MLKINALEFGYLEEAMAAYIGDAERVINDILHNEAAPLAEEAIQQLIPVSGKHWKGKAPAAKTAKSLRNIPANLAVTITTAKKYQYLYFPNDGTNTRRHVGNQQFFERGGEAVMDEIFERCVTSLIPDYFNN